MYVSFLVVTCYWCRKKFYASERQRYELIKTTEKQKTAAAISIFLLYIKFFYWLRLFDSTAAFIRMLKEIISDIVPFMTFLIVCVAMFANTFLIFD